MQGVKTLLENVGVNKPLGEDKIITKFNLQIVEVYIQFDVPFYLIGT